MNFSLNSYFSLFPRCFTFCGSHQLAVVIPYAILSGMSFLEMTLQTASNHFCIETGQFVTSSEEQTYSYIRSDKDQVHWQPISFPESAFLLVSTTNTDSAHFQGRESANHGLPARLRMLRYLKQQWLSMVTKSDLHYDCA